MNGTSLGLKEGDALPFDASRLTSDQIVAEIIMQPEETAILAAAKARGAAAPIRPPHARRAGGADVRLPGDRVMGEAAHGRLAGKSALITGGGSGIGLSIAQAFADGARACFCSTRDIAAAESAAATLPNAAALEGDVTARADLARACDAVLSAHGSLDIVLVNAGVSQNQPSWR